MSPGFLPGALQFQGATGAGKQEEFTYPPLAPDGDLPRVSPDPQLKRMLLVDPGDGPPQVSRQFHAAPGRLRQASFRSRK